MEAILHTTLGDIRLTLFPEQAPVTVENFVGLATGSRTWTDPRTGESSNAPLYDNVVFHRVIPNFMIQGGDPLGTGRGGPGYTFDDEIDPNLTFDAPYVLAMANAGRHMGKGTNGSQFFITTAPTTWLHGKHTIFGAVADDESKAVVDAISATPTDSTDRPLQDITITSVSVVQ
ncbi:peptidylprolyl isomerase [Actinomyces timonensis]|uniref:peptidylprolyl isomerase n=1 Tax=Actinomyces timonensis TaxID=1288391 RepID=UPI000370F7B9|nr:peptidylprolyl isomerase [Actinomyces timonensis]